MSDQFAHFAASAMLNLLLQSGLVLALGLMACRLTRRLGPATQSAVLRVTLLAVIACPLVSVIWNSLGVDGFSISLPRAEVATATQSTIDIQRNGALPTDINPLNGRPYGEEFEGAEPGEAREQSSKESSTSGDDSTAIENSQHLASHAAAPPTDATAIRGESQPAAHSAAQSGGTNALGWLYRILVAIWIAGVCLLLARMLIALWRWRGIRSRAQAAGPALVAVCESVAGKLGVACPELLLTSEVSTPCLVGWRRPVILLPTDAEISVELSKKQSDGNEDAQAWCDVLAHELGHLRRRDCGMNMLARLTACVLWHQPLAWWMLRSMQQTADEACDDIAASHSADPAGYARLLLNYANRPRRLPLALGAVGFAVFRSRAGRRVLRVLNGSGRLAICLNRKAIALVAVFGIVVAAVGGTVGGGVLHGGLVNKSGNAKNADTPEKTEHGTARSASDVEASDAFSPIDDADSRTSSHSQDGEQANQQDPPFDVIPVTPGISRELIHPDSDGHIVFKFSPDGTKLIGGSYPGSTIVLWDIATGEVLTKVQSLPGFRNTNRYFDVSTDWSTVFAMESKQTVNKEVNANGQPKRHLEYEGYIRAWDLATGEVKRTYQHDPQHGVQYFKILPDGEHLIAAEVAPGVFDPLTSERLTRWNIADGTHENFPEGINWFSSREAPNGKLIVYQDSGNYIDDVDRQMLMMDPMTFDVDITFANSGRNSSENASVFTPDGRLLVGYDRRRISRVPNVIESELIWWDGRSGRELKRSLLDDDFEVPVISISPDSRWIAVTNHDAADLKVSLFRARDQSLHKTINLESATDEMRVMGRRVAFSPDGKWAVACVNRYANGVDGDFDPRKHPQPRIYLIDVAKAEIVKTCVAPQGLTVEPQFSPDGKTLATASHGKVLLWDWETMIQDVEQD